MKTTFSIIISAFITLNLIAQDGPIKDREIQVEKKYDTEIYAVEPIFDFASINTIPRRSVSFTQDSLVGIAPYTPAVDIKVRPVAYKNTPQERLHKAFVKLDKGTTNVYHGQGGLVYSAANYFNIKANASYDEWQDNTIEDQNIKKINGALGMTYYVTNALKTNLDISYDNNSYGRYGGQSISEATGLTSGFDNYHVNLGINSFRSAPAKFNYGLNIGLNKWNDKESEASEHTYDIEGNTSFNISKSTTIEYKPTLVVSNSAVAGDATVLSNTLGLSFNTPRAFISVGGNVAKIDAQWEIWPNAKVAWELFSQHKLSLVTNQTLQPLGAGFITNLNPYRSAASLNGAVPFRPEYKAIKIAKNIDVLYNATLSESLSIAVSAGYSKIKNDLNFQVIENEAAAFYFDLVNYQVIKSELEVSKSLLENRLQSNISIGYQHFINPSATLWHRPNLLISTGINYTPISKLNLSLDGQFNDPQSFTNDAEVDSGWKANVSFGARYDIFKHASIYFNADNIINNRYQVWNEHSSFGRNISGGVLVKF